MLAITEVREEGSREHHAAGRCRRHPGSSAPPATLSFGGRPDKPSPGADRRLSHARRTDLRGLQWVAGTSSPAAECASNGARGCEPAPERGCLSCRRRRVVVHHSGERRRRPGHPRPSLPMAGRPRLRGGTERRHAGRRRIRAPVGCTAGLPPPHRHTGNALVAVARPPARRPLRGPPGAAVTERRRDRSGRAARGAGGRRPPAQHHRGRHLAHLPRLRHPRTSRRRDRRRRGVAGRQHAPRNRRPARRRSPHQRPVLPGRGPPLPGGRRDEGELRRHRRPRPRGCHQCLRPSTGRDGIRRGRGDRHRRGRVRPRPRTRAVPSSRVESRRGQPAGSSPSGRQVVCHS